MMMTDKLGGRGFFWWFNEPALPINSRELAVPGSLTITDDGQIELETHNALCLVEEQRDWSKPLTFSESRRICGWLASSGAYVLLEGLERVDFSLSDESPQQQEFTASLCTQRDSPFPADFKEAKFDELRIELSGLEDWLGLEGIALDRQHSNGDEESVQVTCKVWKFNYPNIGGVLSIESITTGLPYLFNGREYPVKEAQFKQHYYIVYRPDSPSDDYSIRYAYWKLEELLALLVGTYHHLSWPTVVSKEEPTSTWNRQYFPRSGSSSRSINRFSIWVPFVKIRDVFGDLFFNWQAGSKKFGAGYYLYVSSLRNPHIYAEHRFVNLVWSIEALHRKQLTEADTTESASSNLNRVERILSLFPDDHEDHKWLARKLAYAHEPSLEARIVQCLRMLPFTLKKSERAAFAKACQDRRNDISHAGGPRENRDYDSFHDEISRLADALDHLLHALLLHQIGLNSQVLFETMTNSLVSERVKAALAKVDLHIRTSSPQTQ